MNKRVLVGFATVLMLLTVTLPLNISLAQSDSKILGIQPLFQYKDTKMLCLQGCSLYGKHAWDVVHEVESSDDVASCDHCRWYCARASIAMINHYYGGNVSQDHISYGVARRLARPAPQETDLVHYGIGPPDYMQIAISWALKDAEIAYLLGKPSLDQIKDWIDSNRPIMRSVDRSVVQNHYTVIDGYDGDYVYVIDPAYGTKSRVLYSDLDIYDVWIPTANETAHARNDEPTLWMDSDNDGIVDFEEINRFYTDPYSNDTDKDGIPDKVEISSYTFLSDDSFDSSDARKQDPDNDSVRAELDWDSDNGGAADGLEDLNHNGKLDLGETDPFNATDDPYVPPSVANFTHLPEKPTANETIVFDASASYSPNGNIVYQWDFGDGNMTTVSEPLINHAYSSTGKYTVALNVTDTYGQWNTTSSQITVTYTTDLNKDGKVNIQDITLVAAAIGAKYNPETGKFYHDAPYVCLGCPHPQTVDLDRNRAINIIDITMVARDYGRTV